MAKKVDIKALRKALHLTQKNFGEMLGLTVYQYRCIEVGGSEISEDIYNKIIDIAKTNNIELSEEEIIDTDYTVTEDDYIPESNDYSVDDLEDPTNSDIERLMNKAADAPMKKGERPQTSTKSIKKEEDESEDFVEEDPDIEEESIDEFIFESGQIFENNNSPTSIENFGVYYNSEFTKDDFKNLNAELINMAGTSTEVIRMLIDGYYQYQARRIALQAQIRAILQDVDGGIEIIITSSNKEKKKLHIEKAPTVMQMMYRDALRMEKNFYDILEAYTKSTRIGKYINKFKGIGPSISAGLLAYLHVNEKMRTCMAFWNYAGLNDNVRIWLKSEGSTQFMRRVKEEVQRRCNERKEDFVSLSKPKYVTKIRSLVKNHWEELRNLFIENQNLDSIRNALVNNYGIESELADIIVKDCDIYEMGPLTYFNTIMFLYNSKNPTQEFMTIVATALNRSYNSVYKGSFEAPAKNNKKIKEAIARGEEIKTQSTYNRLEKYLAMPPFNVKLKKLCYLIEDQFVRQPGSYYGELYRQRKAYETEKNERGDYAAEAAKQLSMKKFKKDNAIKTLQSGKLTKLHIDRRARRWACKIFLSHIFDAMYIDKYGETPEKPPVFSLYDHVDWIAPEVPYEELRSYTDTRNFATVSRIYTPNYTYQFGTFDSGNPFLDYREANLEEIANVKKFAED